MNEVIEVLIVEDDPRIAEIHRRFTEKISGFKTIAAASNGDQAKEWLEVVKPKLVLLDVYLPDMKGIDIIQWARQNGHDVDFIMITAADEVDVVHKAMRGGVYDYIVKPLTFDRFKECLEKYRLHVRKLSTQEHFSVGEIESFWGRQEPQHVEQDEVDVPKGIDRLTLDKVLKSLPNIGSDGVTAGEFSQLAGISASTARRYLEFLVSKHKIVAELTYGTVGRPERSYFIRQS